MLTSGTKAVSTYQPEYPALVMIFISQIRLKTNTKMEITTKTMRNVETLVGKAIQLFACPGKVVHCATVPLAAPANAIKLITYLPRCGYRTLVDW
jgi:hypothetical protein